MTELNDQERRAINDYLSENWIDFARVADHYMSEDEIEALGEKLEKQ